MEVPFDEQPRHVRQARTVFTTLRCWKEFVVPRPKFSIQETPAPLSHVRAKACRPWNNDVEESRRSMASQECLHVPHVVSPFDPEQIGAPYLQTFLLKLTDDFTLSLPHICFAADDYAAQLTHGWCTHLYSLTYMALQNLAVDCTDLTKALLEQAKVLFRKELELAGDDQPHVRKHYTNKRKSLQLHRDCSDVTIQLSLNTAFEGGGLYFGSTRRKIKLDMGQALIYPGRLMHSGCPVTSGSQYMLVYFLRFKN